MRKYVAVAAVAALALVGCSKSDTNTSTSSSSTTTTQAAPTKAEFIKQADAICEKYQPKIDALEPQTEAELEDALTGVVGVYRDEIKELKALPKPAEGAAEWDKLISNLEGAVGDLEKAIPDIVADPSTMQDASFVKDMEQAKKDAKAFGFTKCGQGSSSDSSDGETTTTKKK